MTTATNENKNNDGKIDNIDELFGNPNTSGFEELSSYDSDNSRKFRFRYNFR